MRVAGAAALLGALIGHYPAEAGPHAGAGPDVRVAYLRAHAIAIRTISPADRDFSDLEPLRQAIGSRRIVMLGEESHGDGATFLAKSRLVEFLHERMGFNVLAFESGFYDVHYAWHDLASGGDPMEAVRSAIFGLWTNVRETQTLWEYVAAQSKTARPLVLAGIDSQFTGSASKRHFMDDLQAVLADLPADSQLSAARTRVTAVLRSYFDSRGKGLEGLAAFQKRSTVAQRALFYTAVYQLQEGLKRLTYDDQAKAAKRDYWLQLLASTSTQMEFLWHQDYKHLYDAPSPTFQWAAFNLRDRQMAENLIWLAREESPNEKIIVWAATSHEMRNRRFFTNEYTGYVPMGDTIDRAMGPDVYTIGFTAYEGHAGIGEWTNIGVAAPGSIESLIHAGGPEYAVVDFRHLGPDGIWLTQTLSCRPLGYVADTTDWPATMDGLFYIREMTPSTPIPGKML